MSRCGSRRTSTRSSATKVAPSIRRHVTSTVVLPVPTGPAISTSVSSMTHAAARTHTAAPSARSCAVIACRSSRTAQNAPAAGRGQYARSTASPGAACTRVSCWSTQYAQPSSSGTARPRSPGASCTDGTPANG
ncbi:hypothetical protein BJF78_33195 [Pseudonocardia sp. CNS-139]|nr:hypothetical protein BJF78_33195 [Pseudonocardia sp. CNS-139]